jgi:hypothetical protein
MKARNPLFAAAIRDCIADHRRQFVIEETGEIFAGIVETDLMRDLRERRWRLPRWFLGEVRDAGFIVDQVYRMGTVRTYFDEPPAINPGTGRVFRYDAFQRRKLGPYVTIIRSPVQ